VRVIRILRVQRAILVGSRPLQLTVRGLRVSPYQIIAVALRLFAVWLGIDVLRTVPSFYFARQGDAPGFWYAMFFFALTAVAVLVLWFFPRTVAARLLSAKNAQPEPPVAADTWLAMGCALIGLWLLTSAVPHLVFDVFVLSGSDSATDTSQVKEWMSLYVAETLIALWLILGGRGFRSLFWWAQSAGYRKEPSNKRLERP
jgi:hypothetical protein